jgi:hypothetical protein
MRAIGRSRCAFCSPLWVRAGVVACTLCVSHRAAADDTDACRMAHERGQELRLAAKLQEASRSFEACSAQSCPAILRTECSRLFAEVEAIQPSVVFRALRGEAEDLVDVSVAVDDRVLVNRLDGRAVPIDPGQRVFRFTTRDAAVVEKRLLIIEGEKARPIQVVFPPARPQAPAGAAGNLTPSDSHARIPVGTYVLGGLSVVALGSFVYFGATGKQREHELSDSCAPTCPQQDIDSVHTRYIVADTSLAVSILAGAAAVWLLLSQDHAPPAAPAVARQPLELRF